MRNSHNHHHQHVPAVRDNEDSTEPNIQANLYSIVFNLQFVFMEDRVKIKYAVITTHYITYFCSFRCVETEDEELITPCSVALLGVQMRKALWRMTQKSAQLVLVSIRLKEEKKRGCTPIVL